MTEDTAYSSVRGHIEHDGRFLAVADERDREDYFEAYTMGLFRAAREHRRDAKRDALLSLKAYIASRVQAEHLPGFKHLRDEAKAASAFSLLGDADVAEAYLSVLRDTEEKESARRAKDRADEKRDARIARTRFRRLLAEAKASLPLHARSKWLEFARAVRNDARLANMLAVSSGSSAKDLFYDVVDDLEGPYVAQRAAIMEHVAGQAAFDSFEAFLAALPNAVKAAHNDTTLRSVYEDLAAQQVEGDRRSAELRTQHQERFIELLKRHARQIGPDSHWAEVTDLLEGKREWEALEEHDRKHAFELYKDYLRHEM